MNENPRQLSDEELDALLDECDAQQAASLSRQFPQAAARIEMQSRIDAALKRSFTLSEPSPERVESLLGRCNSATPSVTAASTRRNRFAQVAMIAAAAAAVWAIVAWQVRTRSAIEPVFEPRALVKIYQETVTRGFEPYYACEDPERFAATFLQRQGRALHLEDMPPNKFMLGLSYPGGLSRMTTAMLCRVDGQPVMVFVDLPESDRAEQLAAEGLHVFRQRRHGLAFYEVSPFSTAQVTDYLVPQKMQIRNRDDR